MEYQSPLSRLYHWEREAPGRVFLKQPIDGKWHTWTWKQVAREVRQLAGSLQALGLPKHSHIAMISKNCAHWIICDLAIIMAGHVSIPLHPNQQANCLQEVLQRSESALLFVGKLDNWNEMKAGVPGHIKCISFPFCNNDGCVSWSTFNDEHAPINENIERSATELCSIVYTSGTGGAPKGVMLTFEAFAFVTQNATQHLGLTHRDRFFSYLPLSHIAERMLVEMGSLYLGAQVAFAESLQTFSQNITTSKPTVFLGVHRIWTKFQQGILAKIPQKKLDVMLRVPIISQIVKTKIRKGLGLNGSTLVLTGASPTPQGLLSWFKHIGVTIQESYALTENCCYSNITLKEKIKIGYVGRPFPNYEVRLGPDDEIQVKHKGLMQGYYKEPEKTLEAFTKDGFFRTGDQGFIDEEGFLRITGRIKDLFKTSKGKYVAPSAIEMKFATHSIVEQVCVIGSGMCQPMALVTLSQTGKQMSKEDIRTTAAIMMQQMNDSLAAHEKLGKIIVLKEEWTVDNNLLPPSLKIKRNEIEKRYAVYYDNWELSETEIHFVNNYL